MNRDGMQRLALPLLLLGAVAIAFSPIFVRLSELEPTANAVYRPLLGLPVVWLWMRLEDRRGEAPPARVLGWRDYGLMALAGVFFAGDLICWHWSIRYTHVANATLLANLASPFITFGAWLLFAERITRGFLAGMALALAGVALLVGNSIDFGLEHVLGDALGIATALFYTGYLLTIKQLRRAVGTARLMFWTSLVTGLTALPFAWAAGESLWPLTAYGWLILFGLALVSHVGGQGLIAFAFAHLPASFSSVTLLLQPVVAAALAWLLLQETMVATQMLGGLVILAGIFLARRASAAG